jgi:uncharacterized membrane protein
MNTIIGIFDDPTIARRALEMLRDGPLQLDDVSIISPSAESSATGHSEDVSAGQGAAVGAVWGGLVGLASLLIPGVGPFVAFGALGAALTGAVTGAVVGGISAALIDFSGIPEADARGYEEQLRAGKTLVAVKAHDEDTAEVRRILSSAGADTVRDGQASAGAAPSQPVHVAMYDESGRRRDLEREYGATSGATVHRHGIYDVVDNTTTSQAGHTWTSGEDIGEGQGTGPRKDTGMYDAHQWVGAGQRDSGHRAGDAEPWTSGEFVGEGQGKGPSKDTGEYDAKQWVGEGQGEVTGEPEVTPDRPNTPPPAQRDTK